METDPHFDPAPRPGDEIRQTTCYMCACRCGIDVYLKDGRVAYIEGNRDHPVNRGVLCAKGAAGVMQHRSAARLTAPLRRTGRRGSGEFETISWEEALAELTDRLSRIRHEDPRKLAFFTGRDQSQSFTGFWAQQFGTPNYAAHGGFCSVNMAAAGIYTMGGSFWEFASPDWEQAELFVLFGTAEDHDSNPIKTGLARLKERGVKIVAVNPIRTGYNAIADEWLGVTPGTDGLLVLSLVHCLLRAGKVDLDYLARWTNAPCLLNEDPNSKDCGLLMTDGRDRPLVIDRASRRIVPYDEAGILPDLAGRIRRGGTTRRTVFQALSERYLDDDYAPETVARKVGIPADRIRRLAADLAGAAFERSFTVRQDWTDFRGERHAHVTARPVSMHAMRGISAHSNGFQTARAIHLLQILLGAVECPGAMRFRPPYPKPAAAHPRPHATAGCDAPLDGPHLGFPMGPEDLLLDEAGQPQRLDKAFSWENPLSVHGLMHMVISNAHAGDPYEIDTLFLSMANMAWNSTMNTSQTMGMLADRDEDGNYIIPYVVCCDAYASEMVAYADLVLPDTTYLERHDCISLLDRPISDPDHAGDAIRWPVVEPDRDVRAFQSVLTDLAGRLRLPGFVDEDGAPLYDDYAHYMMVHERRPGIGPLAGWRLGERGLVHGRGEPNLGQIDSYRAHGGFATFKVPQNARYMRPWSRDYWDWAVSMGFVEEPQPYLFSLWCEPLAKFRRAAEGYGDRQPPERLRAGMRVTHDPLPVWYPPLEDGHSDPVEYPYTILTQRPAAMYHSWGAQNVWLRQIHGQNPLYLPSGLWEDGGFAEGDWARVTSIHGEITVPVALMAALNPQTVWTWNAIGKRRGAWALERRAPEATKGFLVNHLIHELQPPRGDGMRWSNADPVTGQAAWFDCRVKIERVDPARVSHPAIARQASPVGIGPALVAGDRRGAEVETAPGMPDVMASLWRRITGGGRA